jgi:hypothetical protein
MSILKDRVNKIGEKREAGRKSAPVGERARVGNVNNLSAQGRAFENNSLVCVQQATDFIRKSHSYANKPFIIKRDNRPSLSQINLMNKITKKNYNRCTIVYTSDSGVFADIYKKAIIQTLNDHEEVLIGEVTIADSGDVPKDYLVKKINNNDTAIFSDTNNNSLILQNEKFYQIFYSA